MIALKLMVNKWFRCLNKIAMLNSKNMKKYHDDLYRFWKDFGPRKQWKAKSRSILY